MIKNAIKKISVLLLLITHLGCWASQASAPAAVFIMNTANPFFEPQYQLVAYTETYTILATTNAVQTPNPDGAGTYNTTPANLPFYGYLNAPVVTNGYMSTPLTSSASTVSLAISGQSSLSTNPSMPAYAIGLTDLAELSQRYGATIASMTFNGFVFPSDTPAQAFILSLPSAKSTNTLCLPVANGGTITFNTLHMMPLIFSATSATTLSNIYKTIIAQGFAGANIAGIDIGWYPTGASCTLLSCDPQATSATGPAVVSVVNQPINQFTQLQNWFTTSINLQVTPANLLSVKGVSATQPSIQNYASLLNTVFQTPISMPIPAVTNFVVPIPSSSSSAIVLPTISQIFSTGIVYVPLFMADPGLSAELTSKNSPNMITQTSTTGSPYIYTGMNAWKWQNKQLVDKSGQKVSYADGPRSYYQGQNITDYNPQKSMMSDFYGNLSF